MIPGLRKKHGRHEMAHKKLNLPKKICPVCGRLFQWRKKWARVWEQVKYCSEACRRKKTQNTDSSK